MRRHFVTLVSCFGFAACAPAPPAPPGDVTLDAPAAGQGFQLTTGFFDVPAGAEVQRCFFFRVPGNGADPVWIGRLTIAQNSGSHHFNVFRVKTVVGLDGDEGDVVDGGECWKSGNWADWPLVMNSQDSNPGSQVVDWTLPEGVAHKLMPGEKLMLQSHYVNATTQTTPGRAGAIINFENYKGTTAPMELGTVFATNQNIRVCPGEVNRLFETTCKFARQPVKIIGANGHFHSRGLKFEINAVDADNNPMGAPFYESTTWDDPPFIRNIDIDVPQNGGVGWSCSFNYVRPPAACAGANNNCAPPDGTCADASSTCCISFGGKVEQQEHCNAFVYYYPKVDDATCF